MKSILFIFLLVSLQGITEAQKQANNWHFGNKASINFENNDPIVLDNSMISATNATVSYSHPLTGELLFYSNGKSIWNNESRILFNGEDLMGEDRLSNTSTQTYCVPKPNSNHQYYLFSFSVNPFDKEDPYNYKATLYYSIVDMKMDNGKGGIIQSNKNILLKDSVAEKIGVIPHANDKDYWLLIHELNSNVFHTYLINDKGIIFQKNQSIGSAPTGYESEYKGVIKASPDNNKFIVSTTTLRFNDPKPLEIFGFDNENGNILDVSSLGEYGLMRGVSFSPDSKLVYIQGIADKGKDAGDILYQLNLNDSNPVDNRKGLIRSDSRFASISQILGVFQLELAPNGKIYGGGAIGFEGDLINNNLLVINSPNKLGRACDVSFLNLNYADQRVNNSLPTFIQSIFKNLTPDNNPNIPCRSAAISLYPNPVSNYIFIDLLERCFKPYKLSIFNSHGQLVADLFIENSSVVKLNIKGLSSGVYNVLLDLGGNIITKRFVKLNYDQTESY